MTHEGEWVGVSMATTDLWIAENFWLWRQRAAESERFAQVATLAADPLPVDDFH